MAWGSIRCYSSLRGEDGDGFVSSTSSSSAAESCRALLLLDLLISQMGNTKAEGRNRLCSLSLSQLRIKSFLTPPRTY